MASKQSKEEIITTYYDRKMDDAFVESILKDYPWLIEFVKKTPELDFQTGHDPKQGRSWFSVYRGTSRVLTFKTAGAKKYKREAASTYMKIAPKGFFESPTEDGFVEYLDEIKKTDKLARYYESVKGKKEGYYQNLIGRRYTFNTMLEDDFIVIDKEMVVGFKNDLTKTEWNKEIIAQQETLKKKLTSYKGKLPQNISPKYGEFDFLAMKWNGDIIIMELKQGDPSKTALSPIQVRFYNEQFHKLQNELMELSDNIMKMIQQKVELGIINIPEGKSLPQKLSGKIETCVIVGEEAGLSNTICNRFRFVRKLFLPEMKAYTCKSDGTLIVSKKLE